MFRNAAPPNPDKVLAPEPSEFLGQSQFLCLVRACSTAGGKASPCQHQALGIFGGQGKLRESRRGQGGKNCVGFPMGWSWRPPPSPWTCQLFLVLGQKGKPISWGDAKGRMQTKHSRDGLRRLGLDCKVVGTNGSPSGTQDFMYFSLVAKHGSPGPGQERRDRWEIHHS